MPLTKVSDIVADFCWEGVFQHQAQTTDGPLEFTLTGGNVSDNINWFQVPQTTVTLQDGAVNSVALFYELGTIDLTTNVESLNYTLLYRVTTAGGVITNIEDVRTHYKKRKLTVFAGDLAIDDYTKKVFEIGGYTTWTYPREDSISKGYIQDLGNMWQPAALIGNPANYAIEDGPGAAALKGIRIKRVSGTGDTDLESIMYCTNFGSANDPNSSTPDGDEFGALAMFIYIDADDLTGGPFYLSSQMENNNANFIHWSRVNADGSVQVQHWLNASTTTFSLVSDTGVISPRTWHHLCYTTRPGANMDVYVDGVLKTNAGSSDATRTGWFRQMALTRQTDYFDIGGASYGYNGSSVVVNRLGTAHNADIVFAGIHWWWGVDITAARIADLNTLGRI